MLVFFIIYLASICTYAKYKLVTRFHKHDNISYEITTETHLNIGTCDIYIGNTLFFILMLTIRIYIFSEFIYNYI